ncbi:MULTISPECIES: DUF3078 domain-containing protein [Mesoflavibacter]|uniref:DUF3078 domain-containing protein n=1 Tax=Mesoflavibacter profundi TaxID=2708110 RepID=A0ABT4RVV5_9FLAO|nr:MULTISPECIES: DUF3078 domain-containing protein [Mesoflavibacter]MDA0175957.1 DUF3078 domain-containing protein [Mesoflavibacter profundi]QIJ89585.1 hypothetical protein C7H62_1776 [Mesoflavibacter sp. HG96]QIJ92313.1 hypothetical protein C7H56_1776 [Mesoflavibacter sp. HG37]
MRFFLTILTFLTAQILFAQTDSIVKNLDTLKWKQVNRVGMDINEVTFVNWSAGGANSISALLAINSSLRYKKNNLIWFNAIKTRYGVNKQESQKLRKTEDELELISTIGYRRDTLTNWYFSGRFNFKTQYSNGYNYPNRDNPISRFMSPGYVFLGGGAEYGKNIEKLSFYLSPLTFKGTFVLDQSLADKGAFGVTPAVYDTDGNKLVDGETVRTEMGILITNAYEAQVMDNIYLRNQLSLYTDYLNSFGNIDVDWEVVFDFKVNDFVKATLGSHIKYDNDVKIIEETDTEDEFVEKGASVQWKQLLGIGVVVDF